MPHLFVCVTIDLLLFVYYNTLVMKGKRYYYSGELSPNKIVNLEGEEFHHLSNVMRSRVGDEVILFNGDGNFYYSEIKSLNKKYAEIFVKNQIKSDNEPTICFDLYQALAKGDKLSLIMQKITELGANSLCLFESKFCDVKANTNKIDRMDSIAISAAKQCGRATITKTEGIFSIKYVAQKIKDYDTFFVAYETSEDITLADCLIKNNYNKIAVMIGAEGGFADDEIKLLQENGAKIVSLGKRILRTETAAISCTALATQILERKDK